MRLSTSGMGVTVDESRDSTRGQRLPKRRSHPGPTTWAGAVSLQAHKGGNAVGVHFCRGVVGSNPAVPRISLAGSKQPRQQRSGEQGCSASAVA